MKSFIVDGQEYQFPDDYSDEQAQSILTKQGVIKGAEPKSARGFAGNVADSGGRFASGVIQALTSPLQTAKGLGKLGAGTIANMAGTGQYFPEESAMADAVGKSYKDRYGGVSNIGETLYKDPVGAAADVSMLLSGGGAALGAAGKLSNSAKLAKLAKMANTAADFTNPMSAVTKPVAYAAKKVLPGVSASIAESALAVRPNDRAYGKTPGAAILKETSGFSPEAIGQSAQARLSQLTPELEARAAQSTTMASLNPALSIIDDAITKAKAQNARDTVAQLRAVRETLTKNADTGLSLAPDQTASGVLNLKRGLSKEHIQNWKPEGMKDVKGVAGKAYGALDEEFDRAVPGGAELNDRISSLIPVAQRGESVSRNAPTPQKLFNRFAAHTGALASGLLGYQQGGVAGGLAGLVIPELIANPKAQMALARTMNAMGTKKFPKRITRPIKIGATLESLHSNSLFD